MDAASPSKLRMTSDQRRTAIVEAAVRLFALNGFRGTTTRQLANAVGVTEPVLYHHFATKRDLYSAMIEHIAESGPLNLERLSAEDITDEEFFLQLAKLALAWHIEDPTRIRLLLFSALEGHGLSELFYQSHVLPFFEALAGYIEHRMTQGLYRSCDAMIAARAFCGMICHYGYAIAVFGHKDDAATQEKTLTTMVRIFVTGMRN